MKQSVEQFAKNTQVIYDSLVDTLEGQEFDPKEALTAICRLYCATAASMELHPDTFFSLTFMEFAEQTGIDVQLVNLGEGHGSLQ